MYQQIAVLIITVLTLVLFVSNKIRYDFVSLIALLLLVIFQIIDVEDTFLGFSHPALITVASVLVISQALIKTGVVDRLVVILNKGPKMLEFQILSLMAITAILSAFMNNIGALALIFPIALKIAKERDISPSKLLMPVAFSSLMGGMMTSIGTPPNLIISAFREEAGKEAFGFFEFFPTGFVITLIGIVFTSLIGYKLIPLRKTKDLNKRFNLEDYLFELVVTKDCSPEGIKLRDFANTFGVNINVVNIVRKDRQIISPGARQTILVDDILIVRAMPDNLTDLLNKTCLELKGADRNKLVSNSMLSSADVSLVEVVLRNDSHLIGRTAIETKLRNRYNANLIAVSRKGVNKVDRLKNLRFAAGDILLLQVPNASLEDMYSKMRALPLNDHITDVTAKHSVKKQIMTTLIFVVAIVLSAFNIIPIQIAFLATALLFVILNILTPREFYDAIEWPTIIMIGSLFALGNAIDSSGASTTIANLLANLGSLYSPKLIVLVLMVLTIILTNIINNTAATILMAPIALSVASVLGVNVDPFLMAVAIGASTSFLTPIGHQSNMLVMGPGGYQFKDYWKLGLPLTIIAIAIGIPLILLIWNL